ncbi:MAG: serine hydrolase domain-containing protein [Vulcanimicrobiaceae bacterium]
MEFEFARGRKLIRELVGREYTAAVLRVEIGGGVACEVACGAVDDCGGAPIDPTTRFDLASLTKLFVATRALELAAGGAFALDAPLVDFVPEWCGTPHAAITLRHLLAHTAGMRSGADYRSLFDEDLERFALTLPLIAPVGERVVYSDLGFIALGIVLARIERRSLSSGVGATACRIGAREIGFRPPARESPTIPATEADGWRGRIRGTVHDEKAALLNGVAGHAGLFGTARDVAQVAEVYLGAIGGRSGPLDRALARAAITEQASDPILRRGLGWALKTSDENSCGALASRETFGHTGFTGTSVWADPLCDCSIVLLTNAVYYGRRDLRPWRSAIHDAILTEVRPCASSV